MESVSQHAVDIRRVFDLDRAMVEIINLSKATFDPVFDALVQIFTTILKLSIRHSLHTEIAICAFLEVPC